MESALLKVVGDIERVAGRGLCTVLLALDISAAFDGDEVITLDAKKHTETPLMEGIDPACTASSLVIAQHSDPYRKIGTTQVL